MAKIEFDQSKRDFLKTAGIVAGGVALAACRKWEVPVQNENPDNTPTPTATVQPMERIVLEKGETFYDVKTIHGVDVYGLAEPITKQDQVQDLYTYFDTYFGDKHGVAVSSDQKEKNRQRKELFPDNERNLEVVVRRSAYDCFTKRKEETGVDFVEWIQMHVDVTNRILENSKPPTTMRCVLKRIMVIDDELVANQWDEEAFKKGELVNWDVIWRNKLMWQYPIDIDQSWAIANDYRPGGQTPQTSFYLYELKQIDGQTLLKAVNERENYANLYLLRDKIDSLVGKDGVILDFGLIHEWLHYLLNAPDVYQYDISNCYPSDFGCFRVPHSFDEPFLSPYLVDRLNYNIKKSVACITLMI